MIKKHKKRTVSNEQTGAITGYIKDKALLYPSKQNDTGNTLLRLPSHVGVTRVTRTCNGRNTFV